MIRSNALKLVATKAIFGASLVVGFTFVTHDIASAVSEGPLEDEPGWSCVDSGNRVCGPRSDDYGHTPGCYDEGGVLVALWPCKGPMVWNGGHPAYAPTV